MNKPLVFARTTFKYQKTGEDVETWELFNIGGGSPIVHAMWDPIEKRLGCQYQFSKENLVDYPMLQKQGKDRGKMVLQERKMHQWFIVPIKDHDAIRYILENFVANYEDQDWFIEYAPPKAEVLTATEEEYDEADVSERIDVKIDE